MTSTAEVVAVTMDGSKPTRKPFSDAIPSKERSLRPLATVVLSPLAGWYASGSPAVAGIIFIVAVFSAIADALSSIFLLPPFLMNPGPEQGLSRDANKLPVYWDKATIEGPKAMNFQYEDVSIPIQGSFMLRGWLLRANSPKAIIIMSHGAGRDRRSWLRHCSFLTSNGYSCLLYDSRNHGTSDRIGAAGTTLGSLEWKDVVAVTRWVRENFPPKVNIVLMGTSTGAVSSIIAAALDVMCADNVRCVIAENPFTTAAELVSDCLDTLIFRNLICRGSTAVGTAVAPFRVFFRLLVTCQVRARLAWRGQGVGGLFSRGGALMAVRRLQLPLLVMHGDVDKIVPLSHGERIAAAAAGEVEFWKCEGADHCQLWDVAREEYERRVLAFLASHAGGPAASPAHGNAALVAAAGPVN